MKSFNENTGYFVSRSFFESLDAFLSTFYVYVCVCVCMFVRVCVCLSLSLSIFYEKKKQKQKNQKAKQKETFTINYSSKIISVNLFNGIIFRAKSIPEILEECFRIHDYSYLIYGKHFLFVLYVCVYICACVRVCVNYARYVHFDSNSD